MRSDVDPPSVAISLAGLLRGIGMQLLSAVDDPLLDRVTEQAVDLVHRSLAAPGGP